MCVCVFTNFTNYQASPCNPPTAMVVQPSAKGVQRPVIQKVVVRRTETTSSRPGAISSYLDPPRSYESPQIMGIVWYSMI